MVGGGNLTEPELFTVPLRVKFHSLVLFDLGMALVSVNRRLDPPAAWTVVDGSALQPPEELARVYCASACARCMI